MAKLTCRVAALVFVLMAPSLVAASDVPAPLLTAYLKVQTDLAGDQLQAALADARVVAAEAAKAGQSADKVKATADKLAAAKEIEAARTAFGDLSDAFIQYVGGKSPGGEVKLAYCPMVKKSWLQKGDQIQNPYFGKAMSTCGELKK